MARFTFGETVRHAVIMAGVVLAIGGGIAAPANAAVKTRMTIAARTALQIQNCEDLGGTAEAETVKGSVTNGHQPIKSTVSCSGGGLDGTTCTNVKGSTSCTSSRVGGDSGGSQVNGQVVGVEQVSQVESATEVPVQTNTNVGNVGNVELKVSTPTPLPTFGNPIPTIVVEAQEAQPESTATATETIDSGSVIIFQAQPVVIEQAP